MTSSVYFPFAVISSSSGLPMKTRSSRQGSSFMCSNSRHSRTKLWDMYRTEIKRRMSWVTFCNSRGVRCGYPWVYWDCAVVSTCRSGCTRPRAVPSCPRPPRFLAGTWASCARGKGPVKQTEALMNFENYIPHAVVVVDEMKHGTCTVLPYVIPVSFFRRYIHEIISSVDYKQKNINIGALLLSVLWTTIVGEFRAGIASPGGRFFYTLVRFI